MSNQASRYYSQSHYRHHILEETIKKDGLEFIRELRRNVPINTNESNKIEVING